MAVKSVGATNVKFQGLSTDHKPLERPENGAVYQVIDTGEIYRFHNGLWELDFETVNRPYRYLAAPNLI